MNEDLTAWFHCGRCASLFQSVAGDLEDRRCTNCGEDPSLGLEAETPSSVTTRVGTAGRDPLLRVKMAEVEKPKFYKREVRRQKTKYFAVKLIMAWALVMGVLAVAAHFLWNSKPERPEKTYVDLATTGGLADEDVSLIDKGYKKCVEVMSGFLAAGTPEVRNQFVRTPIDTAPRMARFYQLNPIANIDPQTVRGTAAGVIHLKNGARAIETRWATTDGKELDAVFFEEKGEWRMDWEEYVRYGDQPLPLFLSGSGNGEGEFRVFARERLGEQRSEVSSLKIALHAPRFGYADDPGPASPEILVDQESEAGRMIKQALAERKAGKRIYGSNLPNHDPEGMIRLRVKVRRAETQTGREFSIEKVIACHWLSIDDPGVER